MWVDGVVVTHQLKEYIEGPWFKPKSIHCFYLKSQIVKFGKSQLKLEFVPPFSQTLLNDYISEGQCYQIIDFITTNLK